MSPGQRLLKHRREAQREGTSSDPLRGPPSPEGKATGTSSGAARHLPQKGGNPAGISGFASGETDFDKSKIWQNHRGRLLGTISVRQIRIHLAEQIRWHKGGKPWGLPVGLWPTADVTILRIGTRHRCRRYRASAIPRFLRFPGCRTIIQKPSPVILPNL